MMVTTEQIKKLRNQTGVSIVQCKKALEEAGGDMQKAMEFLKRRGAEIAAKKSQRTLGSGIVASYIHNTGRLGSLVVVQSETDFVAENEKFKTLANELAMQVAAMNPATTEELLAQPYIKDSSVTIEDLVKNHIQKFGERIEVLKFTRYDLSV